MSTNTRNRQPEGIPAGGQFAATTRAEPDVALAKPQDIEYTAPLTGTLQLSTAWHDQLPEWPANLPEPEVNFGFDDGKAETYVVVDDKMMTFWDSGRDGIINDTDTDYNPWEDFDEEDQEAALKWGKEVHNRVDSATYGVMIEGAHSPAVKAIILAQATAKPAPLDSPGLKDERGDAHQALTPASGLSRSALVQQRSELNALIGAMDVTEAAAALKKRFPDARGVMAHLTKDAGLFGNGIEAQEIWVTGENGNPIWRGPRAKVAQLGTLTLIPDPYEADESPLRTSRIKHHNGHAWHHYSLDKMAAVTANDLSLQQASGTEERP